jgi:hypothetical protein
VLCEYMGDDPLRVVVLDVDRGAATKIAQRIDGI